MLLCYSVQIRSSVILSKKRLQNYYFLRTQPNKKHENRQFMHIFTLFVQPTGSQKKKNAHLFVISNYFSYLCRLESMKQNITAHHATTISNDKRHLYAVKGANSHQDSPWSGVGHHTTTESFCRTSQSQCCQEATKRPNRRAGQDEAELGR